MHEQQNAYTKNAHWRMYSLLKYIINSSDIYMKFYKFEYQIIKIALFHINVRIIVINKCRNHAM